MNKMKKEPTRRSCRIHKNIEDGKPSYTDKKRKRSTDAVSRPKVQKKTDRERKGEVPHRKSSSNKQFDDSCISGIPINDPAISIKEKKCCVTLKPLPGLFSHLVSDYECINSIQGVQANSSAKSSLSSNQCETNSAELSSKKKRSSEQVAVCMTFTTDDETDPYNQINTPSKLVSSNLLPMTTSVSAEAALKTFTPEEPISYPNESVMPETSGMMHNYPNLFSEQGKEFSGNSVVIEEDDDGIVVKQDLPKENKAVDKILNDSQMAHELSKILSSNKPHLQKLYTECLDFGVKSFLKIYLSSTLEKHKENEILVFYQLYDELQQKYDAILKESTCLKKEKASLKQEKKALKQVANTLKQENDRLKGKVEKMQVKIDKADLRTKNSEDHFETVLGKANCTTSERQTHSTKSKDGDSETEDESNSENDYEITRRTVTKTMTSVYESNDDENGNNVIINQGTPTILGNSSFYMGNLAFNQYNQQPFIQGCAVGLPISVVSSSYPSGVINPGYILQQSIASNSSTSRRN